MPVFRAIPRKRGLAALLAAGWLAGSGAARAAVVYQVQEMPGEVVGAWDVNILADDVHFAAPTILSQVRIRLAIAGAQECKLWLFDGLNRPPLHVATFTNVPAASPYDVSTYDFDMDVQVPRDLYVGFSAQGGGWTNTLSDYWSRGTNLVVGVAGTPGQYYYGPVSGGQLTTAYAADGVSFGCLQIHAVPARIDEVTVAADQVQLAISALPIHGSNVLESAPDAGGAWTEQEPLPAGAASHVWTTNAAAAAAFFRIKTR